MRRQSLQPISRNTFGAAASARPGGKKQLPRGRRNAKSRHSMMPTKTKTNKSSAAAVAGRQSVGRQSMSGRSSLGRQSMSGRQSMGGGRQSLGR